MKITYMRDLIVAIVSSFAFSGLPMETVEAITRYEVTNVLDSNHQNLNINEIQKEDHDIVKSLLHPNELKEPEIKLASTVVSQSEKISLPQAAPAKITVEVPNQEVKEENPGISISNVERDLFARLVEAEAKGEPYEGKVAVATVVLNRVDSPQFPNSVTGVIKQVVGGTFAFSPVQNGEINNPASDESVQAVDEALLRNNRLSDSLFFYNPETATDDWIRTRLVVTTIGNHVFAK